MTSGMPQLREISLTQVSSFEVPTLKIKTDDDVEYWKTTQSYFDYRIFLRRLNESVVGYFLPWKPTAHSQSVAKILAILDELDQWIDDIPPLETPQRFGNLAFRGWGQQLEEQSDRILEQLLEHEFWTIIPHIKPYLLTSFGSFSRMDYGTGHETSFALFLLCLTLVRFFQPVEEEERDLVLTVFLRYLKLCWRLQDVYKLEPAGSQGVWGLDDYCFLPYIFGSGQLRDQTEIPVSAILRLPLPPTNLYFMAVMRIHDVKHGPFYEHSSQLHSIAAGVPNWGKVNSGLFKMYEAEVLGKRVVVQHIPLGGLLDWGSGRGASSSGGPSPSQGVNQIYPTTAMPWASTRSPITTTQITGQARVTSPSYPRTQQASMVSTSLPPSHPSGVTPTGTPRSPIQKPPS